MNDKTIIATRQDKTRQDKTRLKVIGRMNHVEDHTHESQNRVYDINGLSPTINTCGGGNLQPMILQKDLTRKMESETVLQTNKQTNKQTKSESVKLLQRDILNAT